MIGETLGSYRVVAKLGQGGMGAIYAGEHVVLGRRVAIKLLLPSLSSNQELVKRFFNEARATATLDHPGLVQVFDFGHTTTGSAFLVMELLSGESVAARLARLRRLAYASAAGFCRQATSAVGAAHAVGIVHRDLKPDNLFLVRDAEIALGERVKVLDFGIAKLADAGPGGLSMTRTGAVLGTPAYMSPEQCRGAGEVDHRSDIYSLGCILFEMVCGRPPFVGAGTGEIIGAHIFQERPSPRAFDPAIPPALEAVIARTLEKDPRARQQSMQQLGAELEEAAGRIGTALAPAIAIPGEPSGATANWRGSATPAGFAATVPPTGHGATSPSGHPPTPPSSYLQTPPSSYPQTPPSSYPQTPPSGPPQTPPSSHTPIGPGAVPTSTTFGASAGQPTGVPPQRRGWVLPAIIGGAIAIAGIGGGVGYLATRSGERVLEGPVALYAPKPLSISARTPDAPKPPAVTERTPEPPPRTPDPTPSRDPDPPRLHVPAVEPEPDPEPTPTAPKRPRPPRTAAGKPVPRVEPHRLPEPPPQRPEPPPRTAEPPPRTAEPPPRTAEPPPRMAEPPPRAPNEIAVSGTGNPFLARQVWSGHYVCAQGQTALRLRIAAVQGDDVEAVFEFSHGSSGAAGSYKVTGRYDPARRWLSMSPAGWIRQPPGYEMVGLGGTVSADLTTYAGSIQNPACSSFTVRL